MRYVIVGNGVAGTSAAARLRAAAPQAEVTILTEEVHPFYTRIRLPEFLAGRVAAERLALKAPEWYEDQAIDLVLGERVERLDPERRLLATDRGRQVAYDRLLLATGARANVPPIEGVEREGVFTLRTLDDATAIRDYTATAAEVILIGGGVLGLEAGNGLRLAGCRVTVVEFSERLLPRQMDPEGSRVLQAQLEAMGLRFQLGAETSAIAGSGRVEGIVLKDGRRLAGDSVIISAGVRPETALARDAGLQVNRGIEVNDRLETSRPEIFAAGDVAEHRRLTYGIWPAAQQQGEVAGANMAGGDERFTGMVPSNRLKVVGVDLFAIGEIDAEGRYESLVERHDERFVYRKLVFEADTMIGAILYGDLSHRRQIERAISQRLPLSAAIKGALGQGDFSALGE